jgi:phospholipid/cholesterol/gamma-HCH transport system substrate-binding protein
VGGHGHRPHRRLGESTEVGITRLRHVLVGLLALAVAAGLVGLTGLTLTGAIKGDVVGATAIFENCGQGLREGGDVKLRGVLVGRIAGIRLIDGDCEVVLDLNPGQVDQIPENVGAEIRAKTVFGEKWVELLFPDSPAEARIASGDTIPKDRTLDPLEVETILNVALPLLEAIDPEHLAGALEALADGFVGHEDAAIAGINEGIEALRPFNQNEGRLREGIDQLADSSEVLADIDDELLLALDNLDQLNRFTVEEESLIEENFERAPLLLNELSGLFDTHFVDLTRIVDRGATVVGVLAARTTDLDRLLDALPRFNSRWIRNLSHNCRFRQATDEPGREVGDEVPGRCWRVHNVLAHSRGAYAPGQGPRPGKSADSALESVLYAPTEGAP